MGTGYRAGAASAHSHAFFGRAAADDTRCPELDCVRSLLPQSVLTAAEDRAAKIGIGADRVLITSGALDEDTYLHALADSLGAVFEPLDDIARRLCPIDDERLIESGIQGMLPLAVDDDLCLVVAPRGLASRTIIGLIEERPARARQFRLTSSERLNRFVLRCAGSTLAMQASQRLHQTWPLLSAAGSHRFGNIASALGLGLGALATAALAPAPVTLVFELTLAAVFLAWLALRLTGVFVGKPMQQRWPRVPDGELPIYSVISALYREAASVDGLLAAIERLDYPGIMAQAPQAI